MTRSGGGTLLSRMGMLTGVGPTGMSGLPMRSRAMARWRTMRGNVLRTLAVVLIIASSAPAAPSPTRVFFMSLLLPGWGQKAVGTPHRAAAFASVEGTLLLGWIGFATMRGVYQDDYRGFAASVAGANVEGKGKQYFSDLAFYDTRLQHNQVALAFDQPEPVLYPVQDDWQWPTTADRLRYRHQFNRAKTMDQRVNYVLFAVSLNHLASAIDAAKQAGKRRRGEQTQDAPSSLRVAPLPDGGMVVWARRF